MDRENESKGRIIKDPIHGFIKLTPLQEDLLQETELMRLTWIKQLGLTLLVYPGAHQTRLEHSLGTSYIAGEISKELEIPKEERKLIEAAGLLHDIGHAPFSHTLEPILSKDHMQVTKDIVMGRNPLNIPKGGNIPEILEKYNLDPKETAELITEEYKGKDYLRDIISSQMDADQLDYLARDSYYTGVSYGAIETHRIINTMKLNKGRLTYLEKTLDSLEDFLLARDHMYSSVYCHKTVSIAEQMLLRASEEAKERGDLEELGMMTDGELIEKLKDSNNYSRDMANRITYRNLYKQAYTVTNTSSSEEKKDLKKLSDLEEKEIEEEVANESGLKKEEVIVNKALEGVKRSEPRIREFDINITRSNGEVVSLENMSEIVKTLKQKEPIRNIFSIYTTPENRLKVKKAAERYMRR